jgi:perosamine synthetase
MTKEIQHSKPFISQEDIYTVAKQVSSGMHATGEKTREFEKKISQHIGVKFAKATSSGTAALHLALLSLGIKQGDEVIIPSYVCQSVLNVVNYIRARPVLVDIQEDFLNKGHNISTETIKPEITKKTKAIIIPHMFGVPSNLNPILKLDLPIIEDCAQSLGAEYNGKKVGSLGDIGIFSFYATKIISTGQGGMIVTNSKKLADKINDLTTYDKKENYALGHNYGLTDIQSSLGLSQLEKLSMFIQRRKEIAKKYNEEFKNTRLRLPSFPEGSFPFRYIIQLDDKNQRDALMKKLKDKNIGVDLPVFKPLHQYLNLNKDEFKNTETTYKTTISIPCYPALTDEEINRIIEEINASYHKLG